MNWNRVLILGEDRAHRDFLCGLCREHRWHVAAEHIAPRGRQDASDWVIQQFPERLNEVRAGNHGLGLLVAVDGDNKGRQRRLDAMTAACGKHNLTARCAEDPVAVLVPTWSIDTWALFFCKNKVTPEDQKSKPKAKTLFSPPHRGFTAPAVPHDDAPHVWKPRSLDALIAGFRSIQSHPDLPSIDTSRADLRRWVR